MSADSYFRVIVYCQRENRHIVRDTWDVVTGNDVVLTKEYGSREKEKLEAAAQVLDALHSNATAYNAFIRAFLEPMGNE